MSVILTTTVIFLLALFIFIFKVIIPPLNFPRTIPTIPFYVIFLPSIFNIDQVQLYEIYLKKKLEKYGAVKIFFGSRWNILVSKPEYLSQIFKDEETFAKSGNQKKIPNSVMASYTGDNVISAHGVVWRKYRQLMSTELQIFENDSMISNAKKFCLLIDNIITNQNALNLKEYHFKNKIFVSPLVQRLALDNISQTVLGFNFDTLNEKYNPLHQHLIKIKKQIFSPFYLTFPFLDSFPIPTRRRAFKDVAKFREILVEKVHKEMMDNFKYENTTYPVSSLVKGYNDGIIDYKQLSDNIVILLVAGHENPQLLITTCLYLLGKHFNTWQNTIWEEVKDIKNYDKLIELPKLNSFIFESVRMYPPLNTIINRCTTKTCKMGNDIIIPKGTYVGYNNYSCTHNPTNWGEDCDQFKPERWGCVIDEINKLWRHNKNVCLLPSFHGGRRACLGEKLALTELRITIVEIVKQFEIRISDDWKEMMTPAGPLCPFNLELTFEKREKS